MTSTPRRLATKPTYLTTQLAVHARRLVMDAFSAAGARNYHYRVLAAADELGPMSQAVLGRSVSMDRSDVVAAINQLVGLGHVERLPDPTDRRSNVIHVTAAGRRQLRRLDEELADAQDRFLAPLSAAERINLEEHLTTLLEHHDRRRAD